MKLIKLFTLLFVIFGLGGCRPSETSDAFWEAIDLKNTYTPFTFVFASSQIALSGDVAQRKISAIHSGQTSGVNANNVVALMTFPSPSDPQYSPIAEELKFLFDANGNGTFQNYPSFVEDLICYDIDTTAWAQGLVDSYGNNAAASMGLDVDRIGTTHQVRVRIRYNQAISNNHGCALYIYDDTVLGEQVTSSGTLSPYTFKKVLTSGQTATYGQSINAKASEEEERLSFTLGTPLKTNQHVVAVLYNYTNGKPSSVLNCIY